MIFQKFIGYFFGKFCIFLIFEDNLRNNQIMDKVKHISNKFLLGFGIIVVGLMLNACCAKRCPLSSCHQIKDHTHFFGAENDNNGAVAPIAKYSTKLLG